MGKINLLSDEIFNRIAAGEVVEKPASIVKELIENSIDAGAKEITVKIYDGGKRIIVSDNGCGMEKEDLKLAIRPHATSKIKDLNDLDAIKTLGFRGEALPSIAAVSVLTITSRTKDSELGAQIIVDNGKVQEPFDLGAPFGTTVEISGLFEKIPARLKFLRKNVTEENEIKEIADRLILANYNVSFRLFVNDKEVRHSTGKGLNEAVFAVYGDKFLDENEYVTSDFKDIKLYGYINKPAYSKHNRNYQTLIVNGRYVVNQEISFWIYNAFSSFLMKRQYPAYVLYLNIPFDLVDINVHPSKIEVKFIDIGLIKKIINSAIYGSLNKTSSEPKEIHLMQEPFVRPEVKQEVFTEAPARGIPEAKEKEVKQSEPIVRLDFAKLFSASTGEEIKNTVNVFTPAEETVTKVEEKKDYYEDLLTYEYKGKLFNTYLLLEKEDFFIMIDQHAAHERILYDKLTAAIEKNSVAVQELMFPFVFNLDYSERELLIEALPDMRKAGFDISRLSGNSYSISAVPLVLCDFDPDRFVSLLVTNLKKGSINKLSFIKESIMQASCKAAIKGEQDISDSEIKTLIEEISHGRVELFCPHGRPIAVKITKTEVEKWFKRIV